MSDESTQDRVTRELKQAVESGLLPKNLQTKANQLLEKLETPVRIALIGRPKTGKTAILNLLVGQDVIPDGATLPTMTLCYGDKQEAECTLPDGSTVTLKNPSVDKILGQNPVYFELRMPLPALKKISVLEVVAPDDINAIHRASHWASKRAEVVLWCSRDFGDTDQRIWATMPPVIQDHALLMLTHADVLRDAGQLKDTAVSLRETFGHLFDKVLPIDGRSAVLARRDDGTVDRDRMRESGGLALISTILKKVSLGRQAAVDMAEVMLLKNAEALASLFPHYAPAQDPKPSAETEKAAPQDAPQDQQPIETPDGETWAPQVVPFARDNSRDNAAVLGAETIAAFQTVIARTEAKAEALLATLGDDGSCSDAATMMAEAVDHVLWLCDYLNGHGDDADAPLQRARDSAFDAADLTQLMQMERNDAAAEEAIALILQLKRELQADLAA